MFVLDCSQYNHITVIILKAAVCILPHACFFRNLLVLQIYVVICVGRNYLGETHGHLQSAAELAILRRSKAWQAMNNFIHNCFDEVDVVDVTHSGQSARGLERLAQTSAWSLALCFFRRAQLIRCMSFRNYMHVIIVLFVVGCLLLLLCCLRCLCCAPQPCMPSLQRRLCFVEMDAALHQLVASVVTEP